MSAMVKLVQDGLHFAVRHACSFLGRHIGVQDDFSQLLAFDGSSSRVCSGAINLAFSRVDVKEDSPNQSVAAICVVIDESLP